MTECQALYGYCGGCGLFVGQVDGTLERLEHMMVRLAQARLLGHTFDDITRTATRIAATCTGCGLAVWVDDGWELRCATDVLLYACSANQGPADQLIEHCRAWYLRELPE